MSSLDSRILAVERAIAGMRSQMSALSKLDLYTYITRDEFVDLQRKITATISSMGQTVAELEELANTNAFWSMTEAEFEALKSGAQTVASVQSDFRRVIGEFETILQDITEQTAINGAQFGAQVNTLTNYTQEALTKLARLTTVYSSLLAKVNALERGLIAQQGRVTIDGTNGTKVVLLPAFTSALGYELFLQIYAGGNAGAIALATPGNEFFTITIVDQSGTPVDCSVVNETVAWNARKTL